MNVILLTGANGFLGQHLTLHLAGTGGAVMATGRGACRIPLTTSVFFAYTAANLAHPKEVEALVQTIQPDTILHTAAMSKPDECHQHPAECRRHNVDATSYLLQAAARLARPVHFVYVSTDFVFGEGGPHTEEAVPKPLNTYGETKWMAEQLVRQSVLPCTIIRPAFVYGRCWEGMRPGFIQWVRHSLETGTTIRVVNDQQRTPTFVTDICKGVEQVVQHQPTGTYHLAGKELLTPYQMAVATANALGLDTAFIECATSQTFPEPVRRAKQSGLTIEKAKQELGYNPVSFAEGIRRSFNLS